MIKKEYFVLEESPLVPKKYLIKPVFENFPSLSTTGSYNVLPARIFGLSYPQYLRFCRDIIGADIIGKNHVYPVAYFKKTINTNAFLRLLNSYTNLIFWEKEHPDWEEHENLIKQHEKQRQDCQENI